jgi:predicted neuraminidase
MKSSMVFCSNERFPTSHSSSICELPNGELLTTWFAGSREGAPDSVILGSRLKKDTLEWDEPTILVDVFQRAAGNPRLFIGPDEGLWLISPVNYGRWCDGGTRLFLKRSYDFGHTWTDLEIFTTRKRVLGKNKPLFIKPNTWIIPVEYEGTGDVAFMRSTNIGKTWQIISCRREGVYLDQPCIVELASGELLSLMRSWEGYIYQTKSADLGKTWSLPEPTGLHNPNSGIDMVKLDDTRILLAYNPTALGPEGNMTSFNLSMDRTPVTENQKALEEAGAYELDRMIDNNPPTVTIHKGGYLSWGPRTPINLAISSDDGKTWRDVIQLENAPGEFSYPAIILGMDETIHLTYTHYRRGIKYVRLSNSEVLDF